MAVTIMLRLTPLSIAGGVVLFPVKYPRAREIFSMAIMTL
jgi:hypothetical protein